MTDTNTFTITPPMMLAQALILSSWWKPVLILLPIIPWAWVVSKVYDKHANMFALPRRRWNGVHMGAAIIALMLCLFLPVPIGQSPFGFFAGLAAMIVVLAIDLVAYPMVANKDDRVTAKHRVTLNYILKAQQSTKKKVEDPNKGAAKVQLAIKAADQNGKYTIDVPAPKPETPELEVRMAAEAMYMAALASRASQVEIKPVGKDMYGVVQMIDGVPTAAGEPMPVANAVRLMDFWRAAARLDVNDRRRKQENSLQIDGGGAKHIARVTSVGVQGGMRTMMLLDPEKSVTRKLEDLGLLSQQIEELKKIVEDGKGVVLLAARPDMGRTTTLYTITRMHDAYTQNIQTVEVDPQSTIEGVRTNKFDPTADAAGNAGGGGGGEFSTLLRSILRRDPTVVAVAEVPDANTAKEITKSDHERTRIYASIPAADALTAVAVWVKLVGDGRAAGNCLHGVVGQKLLRKLCTNCRVPYQPAPDMLKKLGIPEGKVQQLFKKGGQVLIKNKPETCPMCKGIGYLGQEGVFEVFSMGPEERELVVQGNITGLRAAFKKRMLSSIQNVAVKKAVDGTTSVEEVLRVTAETPPAGGGGAKPPTATSAASAGAGVQPVS